MLCNEQTGDPSQDFVLEKELKKYESFPNREGPKPGQIGGGGPAGVRLGRGATPAGVTGSALADRSKGSDQ